MRIALGVEYNGRFFYGWQKQPNLLTVQGCLEEALSKIANESIEVYGAGRTDAGVHATGQVVHFNSTSQRNFRAWIMGTNTHLPVGISVHWAKEVDELFHARFSAQFRCYQYIIYNNTVRPAILASQVSWFYEPLDIKLMHAAAQHFLGEHDFSSFRSAECQSKTAVRNVQKIDIHRQGDFVIIEIQANAFLHHMVRNIVGVLKKVGTGDEIPAWTQNVLEARDRRAAAETAPPDGLYLIKVGYDEEKYRFPGGRKGVIIL